MKNEKFYSISHFCRLNQLLISRGASKNGFCLNLDDRTNHEDLDSNSKDIISLFFVLVI